MNSRFLTVAAIAGMLLAAGCGGGAGTHSSGLTPTAPTGGTAGGNTGVTPATGGASFSVSFVVPASTVQAAAAASARRPDYVSPASSGLQILIGTTAPACTSNFVVGTQSTPIALAPTPAGGITANTNAGGCGTNTASAPFTAGTAQLSGNIPWGALAVAQVINVNTIPGSSTITPAVNQSFTITNTDSPAAGVLTATVKTVSGTPGTGLLMTATITALVSGTNSNGWTTGNIINFSAGNVGQSTYTYTFTPMTNGTAASGANGFYQATVTFNNMNGATYTIGVVLTDITTAGNPVLSENVTGATVVAAQGPTTFPTLTLKPVVAGVYIPTPTAITAAQAVANGSPAGSFETTVFLTDSKGFVIPNQGPAAPLVADNIPVIQISPTTAGALTMGTFTTAAYAQLAQTTTSITAPPVTAASYSVAAAPLQIAPTAAGNVPGYGSGAGNAGTIWGSLLGNYALPTSPFTLVLNGATAGGAITNVNGVGNPLDLACTTTGVQTLTVKLATTVPATVTGYTYTPGTNVPVAANTTLVNGTSTSVGSVNCNPSIVLPIN